MSQSNTLRTLGVVAICALFGSAGLACQDHPPDGAIDEDGFPPATEDDGEGAAKTEGEGAEKAEGGFADYDEDGDLELSRTEYSNLIQESRFFSQWDADEDKQLVESEFAVGMFDMLDGDADGVVDKETYTLMTRVWFEEGTPLADFTSLDADGDARLTRQEFIEQVDIAPVFARFDNDNDGNIDQTEYGEGLFLVNDRNGDGIIEQDEALLF